MRALTLAAAYAVPLLSGCGLFHRAAERDLLWARGMSAVRVHWTAEPGIDLTEGIAVPVRAYLESCDLVVFTGTLTMHTRGSWTPFLQMKSAAVRTIGRRGIADRTNITVTPALPSPATWTFTSSLFSTLVAVQQ